MKKYLTLFALVLVMLAAGVIAYRIFWTSTVSVRINQDVTPLETLVTIGGKVATPQGSSGKEYVAKVGRGEHIVSAVAAGHKETRVNVTAGFRDSLSVTLDLEAITAAEAAEQALGAVNNVEVLDPQFFGNSDWLVFFTQGSEGGYEGSLVVAHFNTAEKTWKIIEEGTAFDTSSPLFAGAPTSLIQYLEGTDR